MGSINDFVIEDGVLVEYKGKDSIVKIPEGVTSIGEGVFENCERLTNITISDSVMDIGENAFHNCTSLKSITIPDSVIRIGKEAFRYCKSLTSIAIPDSVISIGIRAFHYCESLESININSNNENYASIDGVLFNKDKTMLVKYPEGKLDDRYTIPNSVISIGDSAFVYCESLKSILIPNGVTSIGYEAFRNCKSLTNVIISNSVTSIGDSAFEDCESLKSITIPDSVTSIGKDTFRNCESLNSVLIPDSVTSIGKAAFIYCSSLNSIILSNSVTSIGAYAFEGTSNLEDVYYKGSKTEWGNIDFDNEYEDNRLKWGVTIHYNSSSLDDIKLLKTEEEVSKLLSKGKSEKEVYSVLKNNNIPTNDIIKAFSKVKPDSKMLSSFCDKVIIPNILSIFNKEKGISEYTVGGVAKMLYEKYPENLVNKAIVSVLREQYLVD